MSHAAQEIKDKINTLTSGETGTTGREPFEDSGVQRIGADGKPISSIPSGEPHIQTLPAGTHTGLHTSVLNDGVPQGLGQHGVHSREGAPVGETTHLGQGHSHHAHHEGHNHHHHNDHHEHGIRERDNGHGSGVGTTGGPAQARETDSGLHHPASGGQRAEGTGFNASGGHADRVGALDQESHKYESTAGQSGPTTSGAAGTDRFDTDKPSSASTSGVRQPEGPRGDDVQGKTKSSGGAAGVLATSDHDFTENRSRVGTEKGAYADSHGHFKGNTDGPGGNTALTGREGTIENNPVAQAKSRETGEPLGSHANTTTTEGHEKKGLMDKVKDALHH